MVLVVKDRIKDTSTTSGTGTITLANSPPNGFQAFSVLGNNSTTYYTIQDANNAFEIGLGTYNANTLTRTTVLASSNSGNLVNLTSPSSLWVDYPASKAYLSEEGIDKSFTATASITAGKPVILNSAGTVTQVSGNLDNNYLGVASTSASANEIVNINIPGSINNNQTSLTIGKNYYTSASGVISTTFSSNFVGRAISSTQLLLEEEKGNSLDGFSNGAITKGKPVVMQADGDVAQVVSTSNSESFSQQQGSEIQLSSSETAAFTTAHNNNGTFLVAYRFQPTGKIHARLGTYASNGNITWGTNLILTKPVSQVFAVSCYYDPDNDCFVTIGGTQSNEKLYATILTYSGVTLTEGNFVEFAGQDSNTNGVTYADAKYDTTNKIAYVVVGLVGGSVVKLTVSGTSITASAFEYIFGSYSAIMQYTSLDYDSENNRGTIFFRDISNSYYATVVAFTSASGTLTFGTKVVLTSVQYSGKGNPAHSPTQTYVAYLNDADATKVYYNNLTFSGASITAGSRQTLYTTTSIHYNSGEEKFVYNPDGKFYFVFTRGASPYELVLLEAVVSSTTLNSTVKINQSNSATYEHWTIGNTSISNPTMILAGYDGNNTDGEALTFRPAATINVTTTNLTSANYLGIASDTVANNENTTIQTQGAVNPDQSSLTPGQLYYVQTNGTLSTTAGSPSVVAGIATSATTLLITRS